MTRIRDLLEEALRTNEKCADDVKVKVEYIMVCPQSESKHTWEMPAG